MATQKEVWPELVGKTPEEAKAQVLKDRPDVKVTVQNELSPCTMDLRPDRVRIFTNKEGTVAGPPRTG